MGKTNLEEPALAKLCFQPKTMKNLVSKKLALQFFQTPNLASILSFLA